MAEPDDWTAPLFTRPFQPKVVATIIFRERKDWFQRRITRLATNHSVRDLENLIAEVLCAIYERLSKGVPSEGVDKPLGYLSRMVERRTINALRRLGAQKRRGDSEAGAYEDTVDYSDSWSSAAVGPDEQIHQRRIAGKVLDAVCSDSIKAHHRVAFLAWYQPDALTRDHVDAASQPVGRVSFGASGGLLRDPPDSWRRIGLLNEGWPAGVEEDEPGRELLAYICRSTLPDDAPRWPSSSERCKSMDLLRVWVQRCETATRRHLTEDAP